MDGREDPFRIIFENSPDPILIEDLSGYVVDCNGAAARLHDISRAELIGKHASELVPLERRGRLITDSASVPAEFESESLTSNGRSIPVHITISRCEYLGNPALLLHVRALTESTGFKDELRRAESRNAELTQENEILRAEIAERMRTANNTNRLEEEIRGARRMESVGRLAGGLAQDFNNLLMEIIGRCQLLLGPLPSDYPIHADVEVIDEAAQTAALVTRQLLAFARKQVLQPRVLDLNAVVRNMETMLRSVVMKNIELEFDLAPDLWYVEADLGQIEQVIVNLVVNSIDAIRHRGKIRLQTANIDLGTPPPGLDFIMETGRYSMLAVQDNGAGMDRETLSRIFEPFFTTKVKIKGTGLGLSQVYGIVKQSGGYVVASSQPGEGTTIKVYLPQVQGAPEGFRPKGV